MQPLLTQDPARIAGYALVMRLGGGAMGTVYLARSPSGRAVAVKVVRAELAGDASFRERFRREVAMARSVGGFWTAAVVDADPEAPAPWLATEYVAGPSVHQAVGTHGPFPEAAARQLGAGLAEALVAIHRAGLVHRDLTPSNVLLGSDGPRVIDFGIAHAVQAAVLTDTGVVAGTPGFLSPEQVTGAEVGPPSDVFALGAVLVFAVTGVGPFGTGAAPALLHRAAHGEPDLSRVPTPLGPIVAACLDRDPGRRPTPAQVLADLTAEAPTSTRWLPSPVETLVEEHGTRVAAALAAPGSVRFTSSRRVAAVRAAVYLPAALLAGQLADPASGAAEPIRLLAFLVFIALAGSGIRWLYRSVRAQVAVDIGTAGLDARRGAHHWQVSWRAVARVRIVDAHRRPRLVVWLAPGAGGAPPGLRLRREHGGLRLIPVGSGLRRRHRDHHVAELRAALRWYAPQLLDPSP